MKKDDKKPSPTKLPSINRQLTTEQKERLFIDAYIANGGNATAAGEAIGWAKTTAQRWTAEILERPHVRAEIHRRRQELAQKFELTTENVIDELRKIVHSDVRRFINNDGSVKPVDQWDDDMGAAVSSLEVDELFAGGESGARVQVGFTKKLRFYDKNAAIDKAMKHLGLFEKDNEQRNGVLSGLPREVLKAIVDRLNQLNEQGLRNG